MTPRKDPLEPESLTMAEDDDFCPHCGYRLDLHGKGYLHKDMADHPEDELMVRNQEGDR